MSHTLQGSAATPARSPASEEALDDLRASLRAGIKAAWSREAVRQGVAAAKVRGLNWLKPRKAWEIEFVLAVQEIHLRQRRLGTTRARTRATRARWSWTGATWTRGSLAGPPTPTSATTSARPPTLRPRWVSFLSMSNRLRWLPSSSAHTPSHPEKQAPCLRRNKARRRERCKVSQRDAAAHGAARPESAACAAALAGPARGVASGCAGSSGRGTAS